MAKTSPTAAKEPGRIKQIWQVVQMTVKYDKTSLWLFIGAFVLPIVVAVLVCVFVATNPIMWVMFVVLGAMLGLLAFMYTLNWRAERVALGQIEGRPGAAGQALVSMLRGAWQTSEMPVAFNAKTQEALYRTIGKPGIVLVSEGSRAAGERLFRDEQRKVARIVPGVAVTHVHVGKENGDVEIFKLRSALRKLPNKLTKPEIQAVANRLQSMNHNPLPIPKGIDPTKMRPSRSRLR